MKRHFLLWLLLPIASYSAFCQSIAYTNGNWFNGSEFVKGTWFSINGVFSKTKPDKIDNTIDLNGGFVVPPFGEAHNHNIRKFSKFQSLSDQYLRAGIYYVKNPNCLSNTKEELINANLINKPTTIDACFANGGFTGKGGHPIGVVNIMKMRGEWTDAEGDGNFYNSISSSSDIESKWPSMLSHKPDFIKAFLLFSEEFEKRDSQEKYEGFKGMNPKHLKELVDKAHASSLRVAVHIETAHDFHEALVAGVDEISHVPGFRGDPMLNQRATAKDYDRFLIRKEDAIMAAVKKTPIVTTLGDVEGLPFFISMRWRVANVGEHNLKVLHDAKANIVLGSDSFDNNSLSEVLYLKKMKIFKNLELLKMLCEATPKSIFPDRKIGNFAEGYEASFVVLKDNPIDDIDAIQEIAIWVKQGVFLNMK